MGTLAETLAAEPSYADFQFRMQCLELAARAGLPHPDAGSLVDTAQKFWDFVQAPPKPSAG